MICRLVCWIPSARDLGGDRASVGSNDQSRLSRPSPLSVG